MGKHSLRRNRSRSITTAVLAGGIVASTAPLLPSAHADDVDALIEQMDRDVEVTRRTLDAGRSRSDVTG